MALEQILHLRSDRLNQGSFVVTYDIKGIPQQDQITS